MKNTLFAAMLLSPAFVFAHTVAGDNGWVSGFTHPVLGLDHLLAMLCVGLLSVRLGRKKIWRVPAVFVVVMLGGGLLGMANIPLPSVETAIALSVLVLGSLLALGGKIPLTAAYGIVAFFAVFHGHAHGEEMPEMAQPLLFAAGFAVGTAIIHLVGVVLGLVLEQLPRGVLLLRGAGIGMAGMGAWFLFA